MTPSLTDFKRALFQELSKDLPVGSIDVPLRTVSNLYGDEVIFVSRTGYRRFTLLVEVALPLGVENLAKHIREYWELSEAFDKSYSRISTWPNICDCGKEKFGFIGHVNGCPADVR